MNAPMRAGGGLSLGDRSVASLGLEHTVDVDLRTGSASVNVPLPVTPGRAGMTPRLALRHSSGAGNSIVGFGWSLIGSSSVVRTRRRTLPRYDASDRYVIDGGEGVVPLLDPVEGAWQPRVDSRADFVVTAHRRLVEAGFERVESWRHRATGRMHWIARAPDGSTAIYGAAADGSTRIASPDGERVFSWLLETRIDASGNAIRYEYTPEDADGRDRLAGHERRRLVTAGFTQRYLKRIKYGNTLPLMPDGVEPAGNAWLFEIVLDYGDHSDPTLPGPMPDAPWPVRGDPYATHRPGFELRTHRLCRRVLMFHQIAALGAGATLVGTVRLEHEEDPAGAMLRAIHYTGHRRHADGTVSSRSIPPLVFTYTRSEVAKAFRPAQAAPGAQVPQRLAGANTTWIDLFGEGLPGILEEHDRVWYFRANQGGGRFAARASIGEGPIQKAGQFAFGEIEGNTCAIVLGGSDAGYYELDREHGTWRPYRTFSRMPHVEAGKHVDWLDVNGDGRSELVVSGAHDVTWYPSLGRAGFGAPVTVGRPHVSAARPPVAEDPALGFFFADMTGDGLLDLVRIQNGRVEYWPNLGHGRFGDAIVLGGVPTFAPHGEFDPRRVRLVDLDGSGTADIVYIGRGEVSTWINAGGNRLIPGARRTSLPHIPRGATVQVIDLQGDGTPCLVWNESESRLPIRYLPLTDGVVPRLLVGVDNSMGRETRLRYGFSGTHYLRDKRSGRGWVTRLPRHRTVVDQREAIDHISGSSEVTRFEYHDGIYDGEEGEFVGFGMVDAHDLRRADVADPDAAQATPSCVRTWFHPGVSRWDRSVRASAWRADAAVSPREPHELAADLSIKDRQDAYRALAGQVIRQETFAVGRDGTLAPHPFAVTQHRYRVRRLQPSAGPHDACFSVAPSESVVHDYEGVPDDPRVTHHLALERDELDEVRLAADIAYPRRGAHGAEGPAQQRLHVRVERRAVLHVDTWSRVEHGIPVETESFEVAGLPYSPPGLVSAEDLHSVLPAALSAPLAHHEPFTSGIQARRLDWTRTHHWNDGRTAALPPGQVGVRTLVHHIESACFTQAALDDIFGARLGGVDLGADGLYEWHDGHWWRRGAIAHFDDAAGFFRLQRTEEVDGGTTSIAYDPLLLAPVAIEDAAGNTSVAEIDYHAIAPFRITDPNGNVVEAMLDPLRVAVVRTSHGHLRDVTGGVHPFGNDPLSAYVPQSGVAFDTALADPARFLQGADVFLHYDLDCWRASGIPPRAVTLAREQQVHDGTGGAAVAGRIQVGVAYHDGFGRKVQEKQLVEDGPAIQRDAGGAIVVDPVGAPVLALAVTRWRASGHVLWNRKQQPVMQHEPWFSPTPAFEADDALLRHGVGTRFVYDAIGRQVEVHAPDGSFSRVQYLPWRVVAWDRNDTVNESIYRVLREPLASMHEEKRALLKAQAHADTPVTSHLDPLGRAFRVVEQGESGATRVTETAFDLEGAPLSITDPRGLQCFRHRYDMEGRCLHTASIDAGETWILPDALGRPIHAWDARGVHTRHDFDGLGRPVRVHTDGALGLNHRVEEWLYGDDPSVPDATDLNARGRLVRHRDGAGVVTIDAYEPGGAVSRMQRRIRTDYKSEPDWTDPASVSLDPDVYATEEHRDALGRIVRQSLPDGTTRRFAYLPSGTLRSVRLSSDDGRLADEEILADVSVNARGQRTQVVLGNGVVIDRAYDPETFRTDAIAARTVAGRTLMDLAYTYDPVGNVVQSIDHAQEPGAPAPVIQGLAVTPRCDYRYDPFYRLVEASGRVHQALGEHDYIADPSRPGGTKGTRHLSLNNGAAIERYTRHYTYDPAGNLERIRHVGVTNHWTTDLWVSGTSNRSLPAHDLSGILIVDPESRFDASGHVTQLPHLRSMTWDHAGRLARAVVIDRSATGGVDDAEYYVYGGDGVRIRKVTERLVAGGEVEVTEKIHFGLCEIKRVRRGGALRLERLTADVSDSATRIAFVHRWTVDELARETDDVAVPRFHYQLAELRGSAVIEVDRAGDVIRYEEYFPYGGTSFLAGDNLRDVERSDYRYAGKERDDSTGFVSFAYRLYAPWIGRWLSPDPIGPQDSLNLYVYCLDNPVTLVDPDGLRTVYASSVPTDHLAAMTEETREAVLDHGMPYAYRTENGRIVIEVLTPDEVVRRQAEDERQGRDPTVVVWGVPPVWNRGVQSAEGAPAGEEPQAQDAGGTGGLAIEGDGTPFVELSEEALADARAHLLVDGDDSFSGPFGWGTGALAGAPADSKGVSTSGDAGSSDVAGAGTSPANQKNGDGETGTGRTGRGGSAVGATGSTAAGREARGKGTGAAASGAGAARAGSGHGAGGPPRATASLGAGAAPGFAPAATQGAGQAAIGAAAASAPTISTGGVGGVESGVGSGTGTRFRQGEGFQGIGQSLGRIDGQMGPHQGDDPHGRSTGRKLGKGLNDPTGRGNSEGTTREGGSSGLRFRGDEYGSPQGWIGDILDDVTRLFSAKNFDDPRGSDDGIRRGIPGGRGSHDLGAFGQILYVVFSIFPLPLPRLARPFVRALGGLLGFLLPKLLRVLKRIKLFGKIKDLFRGWFKAKGGAPEPPARPPDPPAVPATPDAPVAPEAPKPPGAAAPEPHAPGARVPVPATTEVTIGLGLEEDLWRHRGTGAVTYVEGGWQRAGLTKVDFARTMEQRRFFERSFADAARNARAIRFDVTSFKPGFKPHGFTQFEFDYILKNNLVSKTTFTRNGAVVVWNGTEFVNP